MRLEIEYLNIQTNKIVKAGTQRLLNQIIEKTKTQLRKDSIINRNLKYAVEKIENGYMITIWGDDVKVREEYEELNSFLTDYDNYNISKHLDSEAVRRILEKNKMLGKATRKAFEVGMGMFLGTGIFMACRLIE